jgi:hypothetical protein
MLRYQQAGKHKTWRPWWWGSLWQQQRTSNLGVSLGLDLVEDGNTMLDKLGQGRELQEKEHSLALIVVEESWRTLSQAQYLK